MCWFNCWILFAKYYQTKKRRSTYSRWWNREDRRFVATVIRWSSVRASRNRSRKCRTWSSIIPYESSQFRLSCSWLVINCFKVVLLGCCGMDGQYSLNYWADLHVACKCKSFKNIFTWPILLPILSDHDTLKDNFSTEALNWHSRNDSFANHYSSLSVVWSSSVGSLVVLNKDNFGSIWEGAIYRNKQCCLHMIYAFFVSQQRKVEF